MTVEAKPLTAPEVRAILPGWRIGVYPIADLSTEEKIVWVWEAWRIGDRVVARSGEDLVRDVWALERGARPYEPTQEVRDHVAALEQEAASR